MANTKDVSVSVYMIGGKLRSLIQLTLEDVSIEKDDSGRMIESKRQELQNAMQEALTNWNLSNV